jgi:hypothetical protein
MKQRLNLHVFKSVESVFERNQEVLMTSKLPHDTVHNVIFNQDIKHQLLPGEPILLVPRAEARHSMRGAPLYLLLSVWVPPHHVGPEVIELLREQGVAFANLDICLVKLHNNERATMSTQLHVRINKLSLVRTSRVSVGSAAGPDT